jgi:hypothetical protein
LTSANAANLQIADAWKISSIQRKADKWLNILGRETYPHPRSNVTYET